MTADKLAPAEPTLRFPEFRNAGPWRFESLTAVAEPLSDRVGALTQFVPMSVTSGVGLVSQEEKFGRTIAGDSFKNYIRMQTNDFAYNKSATKEFPQGYIARYSGTKPAAVPNSIFTCFRPDTTAVIPEYLDGLFHGNHHGRWLHRFITVGARAHGALNVSDNDLMSMPIPLPPKAVSLPEQQRIADCLGSLDDLIAAETRKLEGLRRHKQGLMQQLFPREGEPRPRLRFPEFVSAPPWRPGALADISTNLDNRRVAVSKRERTSGDIPYYGASGIVDYVRGFIFDEDLLCVSEDGANLVARTYPIAFSICGKTWVNNHAHVLRFDSYSTQLLVQAYLNYTDISDFITGMAQPKLNRAMLDMIPIPLPTTPEEQESVADLISSLDDLLIVQTRRIDTLEVRKHGLLQQLFPNSGRHDEH